MVDFKLAEAVFYVWMFTAGGVGNIARVICDRERFSSASWVGRTVAAGVAGGGSICYWLAYRASADGGAGFFLYLSASFAIGYTFIDIRDSVIAALLRRVCKMFKVPKDGDEAE